MSSSASKSEIEKFSKDAPAWWDEHGPFKPLHALNPARMRYIAGQIRAHYGLDEKTLKPFGDLEILDIGCGGGLVCEPLARLGANVTGIDADEVAIGVAQNHARMMGLDIEYQATMAESLSKKYDVVLALEIIEHVTEPATFVKTCAGLVKPNGMVIFSTLNRTPKSFALVIVAAEYILGWVPRGTHDWNKFIKPSELAAMARARGLTPHDVRGLVYTPFKKDFELSSGDVDVNYFMRFTK